MNKRTRDRLYPILVQRQHGEYCKICGNPGNKSTLKIEHLDNNNANNALENLRLACHPCNILKNPRGKSKKKLSPESMCASEITKEDTKTATMVKNEESEPVFRRWLYGFVLDNGAISISDAVNTGAEIARCSQQAVRRYIGKVTSLAGMYMQKGEGTEGQRLLVFKPADNSSDLSASSDLKYKKAPELSTNGHAEALEKEVC
jgi:hypothetical protein